MRRRKVLEPQVEEQTAVRHVGDHLVHAVAHVQRRRVLRVLGEPQVRVSLHAALQVGHQLQLLERRREPGRRGALLQCRAACARRLLHRLLELLQRLFQRFLNRLGEQIRERPPWS